MAASGATKQDYPAAWLALGRAYTRGRDGFSKDLDEAVRAHIRALKLGTIVGPGPLRKLRSAYPLTPTQKALVTQALDDYAASRYAK